MLSWINLQGFKSFESAMFELRPLTILTGLNSSGKSSVLQAVRMLERLAKGTGNCLLEGYGDWSELKCTHSDRIKMEAGFDKGMVVSISVNGTTEVQRPAVQMPEVIYVSANRWGPRVSIPVLYDDRLESNGDNIVKVIETMAGIVVPEIMNHPDSEGETFEYNLVAWLNMISPGVSFRTEIRNGTDVSFTWFDGHRAMNVGFGLSYALTVIVALFMAAINKSIVLIENPEAHLHPRGQTEIARLVSLAVNAGAQVIVETHSDHFFDGVRLFVKEDVRFADKALAYWFKLDKERLTEFDVIHFVEGGGIDKWPSGMFDQFEVNASKLL